VLTAGKCLFNIAAWVVLQRIVSYNVGTPEVGFPLLEHRAEIQKDDVILTHLQVRRILIIGSQSVAPCTPDALVPIGPDSVHAPGKRVDTLVNLAFSGPRANQALGLDL
jgi:hypothetical protein